MHDEYNALIKNNTWTVPQPTDAKVIHYMWLFRHKHLADGTLSHYKAGLIANGSTQVLGINMDETFSLQIIASLYHEFSMTDLGSLNHFLGIYVVRDSSRIFLSQCQHATEILERAHMVNCNLSRTLVDTESKIGANVAYSDADYDCCPTTRRSTSGYCVFLGNNLISWSSKRQPMLSRSNAEAEYRGVANVVAGTFSIKDMGEANVILGIKIKRENKGIVITQSHYIEKILKKFNREDCSSVSTPTNLVKKLTPNTGKPVDQLEYSRAIGCLIIKEYPRTYNEAMQSRDIAFWKEAIHDEICSTMGNDMWALFNLPPCCKPLGIDKFKDRLQSLNTGKLVDHLEYSRAIGCLMYAITSTRPDIAYAVGRMSRFTSNPSRQHWKAITRVFKYLRGTKDYGLSYVGYPSVLEEWLRNLIYGIPIWSKLKVPISIRCDSAPTMAKAYSQVYNGKSRHLGDHGKVISIEIVKLQRNLAKCFMKG
nr:hypothetical protein [Tanacetum cinerariifolium]